ncbi:MAG TPA: 1-deoxy-D-xylulose-5-phosphate reductoisomerase [Planctomycetes bacterium]|nr:1-deoxy-D-xylulose-5-phosphate reductoisomerase [Planctomycetota bacterium]HIK81946.1 1-deoxy-D-xylulose-5-phosphate reductoisomerase [Planctomycetota bacterium]
MNRDRKTAQRRIAILGSTGSIGSQALEVMAEAQEPWHPVLLTAGKRVAPLLQQVHQQQPECCVIIDPDDLATFETAEVPGTNFRVGEQHQLDAIAELDLDLVLNGITGAAGLRASIATLEAGIDLALANKESLVTAGALLKRCASASGARIIPVDSEHSAVMQCIADSDPSAIRRILLTASGGPFRGMTRDQLKDVTVEQALQHPTWKMGPRISIDSATLFNKVLEVIEARELFGLPPDGIEVLVHPQSIVHAIVEYQDGSSIAHLGEPDMRVPIRHALHQGTRAAGQFQPLDLVQRGQLTFEQVDAATFPALEIAQVVMDHPGTTLGAVLNAADEEAVAGFLSGSVGFLQIYQLVEKALQQHSPEDLVSLEQVIETDRETRERVRSWYL